MSLTRLRLKRSVSASVASELGNRVQPRVLLLQDVEAALRQIRGRELQRKHNDKVRPETPPSVRSDLTLALLCVLQKGIVFEILLDDNATKEDAKEEEVRINNGCSSCISL